MIIYIKYLDPICLFIQRPWEYDFELRTLIAELKKVHQPYDLSIWVDECQCALHFQLPGT